MPITAKNIVFHEFIGLLVKVRQKSGNKSRSAQPSHEFRTEGVVVDETKHLFLVETKAHEIKKIIKKNSVLRVTLPDEAGTVVEIDGTKLVGNPEDRLKNIRKKRWK